MQFPAQISANNGRRRVYHSTARWEQAVAEEKIAARDAELATGLK
jgi:hypothetical protein